MILVTGANGLLGSFLANHFLDEGKEVVGLVRKNSDLTLLQKNHSHLKLHVGDVLDIPSLALLFENYPIEYVIHAAAIVSFQKKDRDLMEKINVEGTANIINICLKYAVRKFVHISSVAAIGRSASGAVSEETPWRDSIYNTWYGKSKYAAEMEVWRAQVEGLPTVIVNPSVIIAPADGQRSSSRFFTYIKKEPLFYPVGNFNYIDIRDVANIVSQLLANDIQNQRYILNAGTTSYKDFFEKAALAQGLKPPAFPVKKLFGKLALIGETIRSKLLKRQPMLTSETLNTSRSKITFDNKKIVAFLNYKFLPLADSIDWVWEQYNSQRGVEN